MRWNVSSPMYVSLLLQLVLTLAYKKSLSKALHNVPDMKTEYETFWSHARFWLKI